MKKTWLVARHEFSTTIRRISYILFTISFPLLAFLGILIYLAATYWSGAGGPAAEQQIGYVDNTGIFNEYTASQEGVVFVPYTTEQQAREALLEAYVPEFFIIPQDYMQTGRITRFTTARELGLPEAALARIERFLVANLLADADVGSEVVTRAQTPLIPASYRLDPQTGEAAPSESTWIGFGLAYVFAILFMMSLFLTSGFLLQGVSEEKENRLIEILLSSVSAGQLMTGKVLGLGAAGLLQIAIWLLSSVIIAAIAPLAGLSIPIGLIVFGIGYFILGYLLFGTIWVCLGSIGSTARESSQWTAVVALPAAVPIMLINVIVTNPDGVASTVLTLIPFTAPVTAVMRLSMGSIPVWQLLLSIAILLASVVGAMWLAARIFRASLLMYGRRPTLKELGRYIREG